MKVSDWSINYMTLFSMSPGEVVNDGDNLAMLSSSDMFPADDPLLLEHIDRSLVTIFNKKSDITKSSPCKVWGFQKTPPGEEDHGIMKSLLDAPDLPTWNRHVNRIINRYASTAGMKPALLTALNVRVTPDKGMGGTFVVIFACNYEDLNRFDPHAGQVELVPDASLIGKPDNAMIFPFFNGFELDQNHIKIFGKKATESMANVLYLTPPKLADVVLNEILHEAIGERHDPEQYEVYINDPAKERELFGENPTVSDVDQLPPDEVNHICLKTYQKALDEHGMKQKFTLTIDETMKFTANLDKMNQIAFFEAMGEKFLIVKGEKFLTKGQLTAVEFIKPGKDGTKTLEEIVADLGGNDEG